MNEESIESLVTKTIPQSLSELKQSHSNIEQIAQYCKNAFQQKPNKQEIFSETQRYLRDALSNVAYHVHTVGLHLTKFLHFQINEIDQLELQVKTLTDRLKSAHDTTGVSSFRTMEAVKSYQRQPKSKTVSIAPLEAYQREPLNLKLLDNVGIDLSGNKGGDSFQTLQNNPSTLNKQMQAPPPSMQAPRPQPPPPQPQYPSQVQFVPPPPPPMDDLPPPPPMDDLPPPPMMDDLPPPPPPRD